MSSGQADLRRTFDGAASIYHDARPQYPEPLFDRLSELLPSEPAVLEIGPGTGQATEPLLARGATVRAIELGPHLAATLSTRLARFVDSGWLTVDVGDFEQLPVDVASMDAVVCATAYHWISPGEQLARPARWLRPPGRLAIIDTIQVTSDVDGGYYAAVQPIYERYGQAKHDEVRLPDDVRPPMHVRMQEHAQCVDVTLNRYRWDQRYTADEYRQLLHTFSGPLSMPEDRRQAMIDELVEVIEARGGSVTRPLVITLATCSFSPG